MLTTIAVTPELKDGLKEFGQKGETYNAILERLLHSAKERQLHDLLMDTTNAITLDEARRRLKAKYG